MIVKKKKKKIMHMFTAYCALCHHTTGRFMHCVNATVLLWCAPILSVLSALNDTLEYLEWTLIIKQLDEVNLSGKVQTLL